MSTQLEIDKLVAISGHFTQNLQVNSTGVSLTGHTHTSSNITDFNSSVSGLLPITNITAGSGISISSSSGNYTIANTEIVPHIFLLMGG